MRIRLQILCGLLVAAGCGGIDASQPPEVARVSECGDGSQDVDEGCDDGNDGDGDGCSADCAVEIGWFCEGQPSACTESCGDGIRNEQEECDGDDLGVATCSDVRPGSRADGTLACSSQCTLNPIGCEIPTCGDGNLDEAEECDDGNDDDADACVSCLNAVCGDGVVYGEYEECDDGNRQDGDGCTAGCLEEICGDGIRQPDEQCEGTVQVACSTVCGTTGVAACNAGTCAFGSCAPPAETCNTVDDDCNGTIDRTSCLNQVFRFYNQTTGDHKYQVNNTAVPPGYVSEIGNNWFVYANPMPNTAPLYQLTNGTDHMLSGSTNEGGYVLQTLVGYVAVEGGPLWNAAGKAPTRICRYFAASTGDHFVYRDLATPPAGYVKEACPAFVWGFK